MDVYYAGIFKNIINFILIFKKNYIVIRYIKVFRPLIFSIDGDEYEPL